MCLISAASYKNYFYRFFDIDKPNSVNLKIFNTVQHKNTSTDYFPISNI